MARKKKSSQRPTSKATKRALYRMPLQLTELKDFACFYCKDPQSVHIKINKKNAEGRLKCISCQEIFRCDLPYASSTLQPVEVYSAWTDECHALQRHNAAHTAAHPLAADELEIIKGRDMIAQRRAQNVMARGRSSVANPRAAPGNAMMRRAVPPPSDSPDAVARRRQAIADAKAAHEEAQLDKEEEVAVSKTRAERALPSPMDRELRSALTKALGNTTHGRPVGMSPTSWSDWERDKAGGGNLGGRKRARSFISIPSS